jgi:hypothetical protein
MLVRDQFSIFLGSTSRRRLRPHRSLIPPFGVVL